MFLIPSLLLGRLRHQLRNVDYFKLLRMNLEQQCVVCFHLFPTFPSLCFFIILFVLEAMIDLHFDRVTIWRRLLKSVARKRLWTTT